TRVGPGEPVVVLPYRGYVAWKARSRSFDVVSATFRRSYLMSGAGESSTAMGMAVTEEFFQTLGLSPARGRTLAARDVGGPAAVVIGHGVWQRQFGGSSAAIGMHVTLTGASPDGAGMSPPDA